MKGLGYNLLISGVYWGYNPLSNHLYTNFLGHPSGNTHILWCFGSTPVPPRFSSGKLEGALFVGIPGWFVENIFPPFSSWWDWRVNENSHPGGLRGGRSNKMLIWLVVSTHLKNISQIGNLPQVGVKLKNIWTHHLVVDTLPETNSKHTVARLHHS